MVKRLSVIFSLVLIQAVSVFAQSANTFVEATQLKKILLENHYQPRKIDDQFSREIFDAMFDHLDPNKIYFTTEDIQSLKSFRGLIDDEVNENIIDFLIELTPLYKKALQRADIMLQSSVNQKINWETVEVFPRGANLKPVANDAQLKDRWNKWIKYNVLIHLDEKLDVDSIRPKVELSFLVSNEVDEKQKILKTESRSIHQVLDSPDALLKKIGNVYLKEFAAVFDPHSVYLSPSEVENFMGALSSQEYTFGMELRENAKGDISVERLVPGGPAWKSGALHRNDILISMTYEDKTVVSLVGIGIAELGVLLEDNNHLSIQLTIKRSDGVIQTVGLKKEKIEDENSIVKGFVLHGKNKVGYISLPGFYSDLGSEGGSSCANDMARQILKMKKENIQGLILDIRSNGGGSVSEAIELAGIFIDDGPLSIFKNKNGIITTLKDVNRGTIYDGPMVLLIDGRSASASEMLAGALQDYHRAIIAGSASFGKATSQRIFSLDPAGTNIQIEPTQKPNFGFATVTIDKIYRVSGKSVQGIGVQPDIKLPDVYEELTPHEDQLPGSLLRDSVVAKLAYRPAAPLPLKALQQKSAERVAKNPWFQFIRKTNTTLTTQIAKNNESVSLDWNHFLNQDTVLSSNVEGVKNFKIAPNIKLPEFDKSKSIRNEYGTENSKMWIRHLQEDQSIGEAYELIADYISMKK